ncbi:MAG: glutathione peroxidase [Pseudomonadota bacterium]
MFRFLFALALLPAFPADALEQFVFDSIDGGQYDTDAWRGRPILVVNTASLCGFTEQYAALQTLHERYADEGLVVLAVPSDDFEQELGSNAEIKEFCELNYGLTMPMTVMTPVTGDDAHPFYAWLRDDHGFRPRWNFNKVLIAPDGAVVATYGSTVPPTAPRITRQIDAMLSR